MGTVEVREDGEYSLSDVKDGHPAQPGVKAALARPSRQ